MGIILSIVAILVSILSALYAYLAAREAKKANDIGRLNALLALRRHYFDLLDPQAKLGEILKGFQGGLLAQEAYANIDIKLREVNNEIEKYHSRLVGDRI
jgi:hypothetical protein